MINLSKFEEINNKDYHMYYYDYDNNYRLSIIDRCNFKDCLRPNQIKFAYGDSSNDEIYYAFLFCEKKSNFLYSLSNLDKNFYLNKMENLYVDTNWFKKRFKEKEEYSDVILYRDSDVELILDKKFIDQFK